MIIECINVCLIGYYRQGRVNDRFIVFGDMNDFIMVDFKFLIFISEYGIEKR